MVWRSSCGKTIQPAEPSKPAVTRKVTRTLTSETIKRLGLYLVICCCSVISTSPIKGLLILHQFPRIADLATESGATLQSRRCSHSLCRRCILYAVGDRLSHHFGPT